MSSELHRVGSGASLAVPTDSESSAKVAGGECFESGRATASECCSGRTSCRSLELGTSSAGAVSGWRAGAWVWPAGRAGRRCCSRRARTGS